MLWVFYLGILYFEKKLEGSILDNITEGKTRTEGIHF